MQPGSRTELLTPRLAFYLKGTVAGSNSVYLVFPAYRHHAFSLQMGCLVASGSRAEGGDACCGNEATIPQPRHCPRRSSRR